MVSKYDVFYAVAKNGKVNIHDLLQILNKDKKEYNNIHNKISELKQEGFIVKTKEIKIINNKKSEDLFNLISFCISNGMNYNLFFKKTFRELIKSASKKEFFTIKDSKLHPETFSFYVNALFEYGFLLIISKKPLRCKLLKHHFLNNLMKFFGESITFYTPHKKDLLKYIKSELTKYKRSLRLNPLMLKGREEASEIVFIHNSLNLEGNPMTLPDTQMMIKKHLVSHDYDIGSIEEVSNYKRSVDLMLKNIKNRSRLDNESILIYHKTAMVHKKFAGKLRSENVHIKNNPKFKIYLWKDLKSGLGNLEKKYSEFSAGKNNVKEIISFVAYFHNEFQRIHPFIDGNSRTARLLMIHILRENKIPLLNIPIGYFDLYLDLTKRSKKRDDNALYYLLQEIILTELKRLNN